ncbi:MAG: Asp-tRNA(Asn)/Glu-tRNA(Gln) amidotransferase GatCAB subunit B [Chloroflexi bacterium]|nr:Asp-tRNA(Asn)/Glu-tRNA(Gln) amidotransferase GatCAB subunit B [Chloroflexota bacterium]MBL01589.1 Asp-tRNA(Asn)/Glu-tRNA(Gln) amidotransferase GatCAB subunit B [Chloroflexota bacterium]
MEYEAVIGLETHVQLKTKSKMFSNSSAEYQNAEPNSIVDPVSMALPGTLPVVNKKAVEYAIRIGLALNCNITKLTKFDRKNYTYPDLMKGYQITQLDHPIATEGTLELDNAEKQIRINRVHMEEDVARLIHYPSSNHSDPYSLIDINRSGTPLMEIVTEPDLRNSEEVESYINALQQIIRYIGVGTANMEEGSFRCDANISIRPKGTKEMNTKVEVKNMNRIKAVTRAVDYEIKRQIDMTKKGERIIQETRGWNDEKGITISQRSKEEAHDYRFFPEPDIPPLEIEDEWVKKINDSMPELPSKIRQRLKDYWGLSEYDSQLITTTLSTVKYYEEVCNNGVYKNDSDRNSIAKEVANWIIGEMTRLMNLDGKKNIYETKITPSNLFKLVEKFKNREINNNSAKKIFEIMYYDGKDPISLIKDLGFEVISGSDSLSPIIDDIIDKNQQAVNDYKNGKEASLKFLIGQVMKATKGQANASEASKLIISKLS